MKVLSLVTNRYSTFYQNQVKILRKLGVDITNLSPLKQSRDFAKRQKIDRSFKDYIPMYLETLKRSRRNFDLIHANFGLTAPFAVFQPQRPLVLTLWGSDLRFLLKNSSKAFFLRKLANLNSFEEIIVRNEEMKKKIKRIYGKDAHVIPSGVDLQKFKPMEKEETQRDIGWNPKNKHILFPYDPSREVKNFSLAIEIYDKVKADLEVDVKLQIVSEVPHDDIPKYMNAADLMLLTSKSEGSPNTVKEAMACNTAVVSTDVGDVKHLLRGVKNSMVSDNKEELVESIVELILQEKNKTDGRKKIIELDLGLKSMGEKIIEVYKKALNNT